VFTELQTVHHLFHHLYHHQFLHHLLPHALTIMGVILIKAALTEILQKFVKVGNTALNPAEQSVDQKARHMQGCNIIISAFAVIAMVAMAKLQSLSAIIIAVMEMVFVEDHIGTVFTELQTVHHLFHHLYHLMFQHPVQSIWR